MRAWKLAALIGGLCGAWLVLAATRRSPAARSSAGDDIDEWSSESFPASDPPARTPLTGATLSRRS